MTDIRSLPPEPSACPPAEALAAYVDGRVAAGAREQLEDHVSRCDDCYFVVHETGLATQELGAEGRPRKPRAALTYALPIAAALLLGLGSTILWRNRAPSNPYLAAVMPLVKAVGERRFFEARLAGGFRPGPLVGRMRSQDPTGESRNWEVLAAAARIRDEAQRSPTPEHRRALAAAHLVLGDADAAVELLERLARQDAPNAGLQNDLAAACLTRARDDDYARAFEAASKAVELDPLLAEAWFNRALAARALNLSQEVQRSRERLRDLDGPADWLHALDEKASSAARPPAPTRREIVAATDPAALVARAPSETRDALELDVLGADPIDLPRARALADAYRSVTGDASLATVVSVLETAPIARRAELQRAHRDFAEARTALDRGDTSRSQDLLQASQRVFARHGSPYRDWARFHLAVITYRTRGGAEALPELQAVTRQTAPGGLAARCHWMEALVHLGRGDLQQAARGFRDAQRLLRAARDVANAVAVEYLLADTASLAGNFVEAWHHQRSALLALSDVADPVRRHTLLITAVVVSMRSGLPRTAMAFQQRALLEDEATGNRLALAETHLQGAWAAADLHPREARHALAKVEELLAQIPDGGLHDRLEAELSSTRGQLVRVLPAAEAVDALGKSIRFLSERGFEARLPTLYGARGRALQSLGQSAAAEADLRAGVTALGTLLEKGDPWPRIAVSDRSWRIVDDLVALEIESGGPPEAALALIESQRAMTRGETRRVTVDSLRQLTASLRPAEAIVAFYCAGETTYAWVLRRDGVSLARARLPTSRLDALAADFEDDVAEGALGRLEGLSSRLYDAVLAPLEAALDGTNTLTVVADGPLARVPLAALRSGSGRFAVERWTLRAAPYLPRPRVPRTPPPLPPGGVLVVTGSGGSRLEAAGDEADAIAAAYPSAVRVAGSQGAERVCAALQGAEVVHFAGHGMVNAMRPELSSLLLAPAGTAGGDALSVRDIAGLKLRHTRLVSLAACATAGGVARPSYGSVTLASAFLQAGAHAVVAPIGRVDDRFARRAFVDLHRRYRECGDACAALHQLQIALLAHGRLAEAVQSLNLVVLEL